MVKGLLLVGIHATALLAAPTANIESAQAADSWRDGWKGYSNGGKDLQKSNVWGDSQSTSAEKGGYSLSSLFGGSKPSGSSSPFGSLFSSYRNKPSASSSQTAKPPKAEEAEAVEAEAEAEAEAVAAPAKSQEVAAPAKSQEVAAPAKEQAPATKESAGATGSVEAESVEEAELAPLEAGIGASEQQEAALQAGKETASVSTEAHPAPEAPKAPGHAEAKAAPAPESPKIPEHAEAKAAPEDAETKAAPEHTEAKAAPEHEAAKAFPEHADAKAASEHASAKAAPEKPSTSYWQGSWGKPAAPPSPGLAGWEFFTPAAPKTSGKPRWGSGLFGGSTESSSSSSSSSPWSGLFGGYKGTSGYSSGGYKPSWSSSSKPDPQPEPAEPKAEVKPEPEVTKPETPNPETPELETPKPDIPKPKDTKKPEPKKPKPEPEAPKEVASEITPSTPDKPSPGSSTATETRRTSLWQPKAGQKWQIVLDGVPDTLATPFKPDDAPIWDIDLWDAKRSDIDGLHKKGKKVICYFSAGTSESWRPDYAQLKPYNLGKICKDDACRSYWGGEEWVDPKSKAVWDVMKTRIKMAADKGCDGVDPDNMDYYDNSIKASNGKITKLPESESIRYLKFMADEAAKYNMSTGLKNSISILPKVQSFVQFAVNEECVKNKDCGGYGSFLAKGKPVFHIEYTNAMKTNNRVVYKDTKASTKKYCNPGGSSKFSTIIKPGNSLSPSFLYCDGKPGDETVVLRGSSSKASHKVNMIDSEDSGVWEEEITESPEDGTASTIRVDDTTILADVGLADVGGVFGNETMVVKRSVPMLYRRHLNY